MKNISIIFESSQLNISLAMKGYLQKELMIRKEKFGREFENESLLKRTLILKEKVILTYGLCHEYSLLEAFE